MIISCFRYLVLGCVFALGMVSPPSIQSAAAGPPKILSASVTGTTMTITGANLGPGAASITLGSLSGLVGTSDPTATQLVVTLPGGLLPGTYALTVKIAGKGGGTDSFVVTLGAVGPQGPKGDTGPMGPPGEPGPKWTSLGFIGELTQDPQLDACDQRIVNHNTNPASIFMPTSKTFFTSTDLTFRFAMDLASLGLFIESPTLQAALAAYDTAPDPRTLSATVARIMSDYWNVSAVVTYLDEFGMAQGQGFGVPRWQIGNYEIQESCH